MTKLVDSGAEEEDGAEVKALLVVGVTRSSGWALAEHGLAVKLCRWSPVYDGTIGGLLDPKYNF